MAKDRLVSRTPVVLAAELSLALFLLLSSCALSSGQCTYDFTCRSSSFLTTKEPDDSKATVSLSCGESFLNVTLMVGDVPDPVRVQSMELVCGNLSVIDIQCYLGSPIASELPQGFPDNQETATINLTRHGIKPGDECNIRGCYYYDDRGDKIKFNTTATMCIIPRDCVLGNWSGWSECSEQCTRTRTRSIMESPLGDGQSCEETVEIDQCDTWKCENCSTAGCHANADCRVTSDGLKCSCREGYTGNGTHCDLLADPCEGGACQGASWGVAIAVVVILLLFALVIAMAVGITVHIVSSRRRGLDHKRVEKFMGTFDPNFTPHLSTNLRKVTAHSELSVFDTLWTYPPPDNDYITLDELGIHIRSNKHARDTDSESSVAFRSTIAVNDELRPKMSRGSADACETNSNFSLDFNTVQKLFKVGYTFQNTNCKDTENYSDPDSSSIVSEPKDFVEDVLRIDIDGFSDTDDGKYLSVGGSCSDSAQLEQSDFVERAFRIDIDDDNSESERDYVNVVGGVSFSYPSAEELEPNNDRCNDHIEHIQWASDSKLHSSLPALNKNYSSSDESLSSHAQSLYSSSLSTSTPTLSTQQ